MRIFTGRLDRRIFTRNDNDIACIPAGTYAPFSAGAPCGQAARAVQTIIIARTLTTGTSFTGNASA
jgi:hypothetical protein